VTIIEKNQFSDFIFELVISEKILFDNEVVTKKNSDSLLAGSDFALQRFLNVAITHFPFRQIGLRGFSFQFFGKSQIFFIV